jgi:predicted 3-demethylubiquinone-9 3-methyltransferase (glyoxalase superfamily)
MSKPSVLRTFLWYSDDMEAALEFYASTFRDVEIREKKYMNGKLFTAEFSVLGHHCIGMCAERGDKFNNAISLSVQCDGQDETDRLWDAIAAEGEPGNCGWIKDKWGVQWQIIPFQMGDYLGSNPDPEKAQANWGKLMQMKRIVLADFVA